MTRKIKMTDFWRAQTAFLSLAAEANTVIALRTLGMMGLWNTATDEDSRMVSEKTDAFAKSAFATAGAIARGARPDQIAMAGLRPLRQKTRPNAARLTKAGPKLPS
ncbi:MAG: antifreeze protein [bacterium]